MMLGAKNSKITCWVCKKPISGARTVIEGMWHCGDCTYKYDYPGKQVEETKAQRALRLQDETLFPLPPKRGKR